MAGDTIVRGAQPVEWAEESNFATDLPDSTTWNWFGLGTSWDVTQGVNSESITYLPEANASNRLSKRVNIKHSEMWEGDITFHPQSFNMLQYFTGSSGGTDDSLTSIQVGEIDEDNSEYRRLLGGVGEEFTLSVDEDGSFEFEGSFIFADGNDWASSDYVDTNNGGSHASEDTTEPHAYKDLSNVQYGGSSLKGEVESLELSVSNDLAVVKDPDVSSRDSLISAIVPVDREITVDVTMTYNNFDTAQEVRSYTAKDFTFDIDSTSFTVSDVRFPEFPYEFTADDLISDSISSDPASDLSWS